MTYAKMAEPIEMQFGMLSWVGPGNIYCMGMYRYIPTGRGTFGVSAQLKNIVNHSICGLGNR